MWHRIRASIQKPEAGRTQARSVMTSAHSTQHKQQARPLKHPAEQSVPSLRPPDVDSHDPATTCKLPGQRTAGNDQPRYATKCSPRFEDRARDNPVQNACPKHWAALAKPIKHNWRRACKRHSGVWTPADHRANHQRLKTP